MCFQSDIKHQHLLLVPEQTNKQPQVSHASHAASLRLLSTFPALLHSPPRSSLRVPHMLPLLVMLQLQGLGIQPLQDGAKGIIFFQMPPAALRAKHRAWLADAVVILIVPWQHCMSALPANGHCEPLQPRRQPAETAATASREQSTLPQPTFRPPSLLVSLLLLPMLYDACCAVSQQRL